MRGVCLLVVLCVHYVCVLSTELRHTRRVSRAVSGPESSPHHRAKRFTDYTETDIEYWINRHRQLRSEVDPPASDMKFMYWDDDLATMAQTWVDFCYWEHGDPDIPHSYDHTGQNMWMRGWSSLEMRPNVSVAVDAWYDERPDYDYETNSCAPGTVCGHYTQVVWAESYSLGCGINFCPVVNNSDYTDTWLIVCNYGPSGNFIGQLPYQTGDPCTKCSSGLGQCYQNMCRPCSEHSEPCVCNTRCLNCGTVQNDCTCKCEDGWYGPDCSTPCVNTHVYCGANPGWYDASVCHVADYIPELCPLMCGVCNGTSENTTCGIPTTNIVTTDVTSAASTTQSPASGDVTPSILATDVGVTGVWAPVTEVTTDITTARSTPGRTTSSTPTVHGGTVSSTNNTEPNSTETIPLEEITNTVDNYVTTSDDVRTTIWTYTGSTECEIILHCLNGGTFDPVSCDCACLDAYQGDECQHEKEQAEFGVLLMIYGNIQEWPTFVDLLVNAISQVLNQFCNVNFELCCPDKGSKMSVEVYAFVNETHIVIATGYPEIDAEDDGVYWAMLVVRPPIDNDLCESGSSEDAIPQRRWRHPALLLSSRVARSIGSGFYMDQEVLYEAIEEGLEVIQNVTGITIRELQRGRVIEREPQEVDVEAVVKNVIGIELIVLFAILGLASLVIMITATVVAVKRCKEKSRASVKVHVIHVEERSSGT